MKTESKLDINLVNKAKAMKKGQSIVYFSGRSCSPDRTQVMRDTVNYIYENGLGAPVTRKIKDDVYDYTLQAV